MTRLLCCAVTRKASEQTKSIYLAANLLVVAIVHIYRRHLLLVHTHPRLTALFPGLPG